MSPIYFGGTDCPVCGATIPQGEPCQICDLRAQLSDLKADLARAREDLKPYLRHLGTCAESRWPASACTCGLSAALAPEQKGV